ncbi:maleate cis-trans isomerase family protein [Actinokineospora globicatena]|uniref:Decarboxylase n=1 Tax=Actinokineospora globicatena TaxID=103729 RepID=A0A9W6QJG8_9PSEU|nr:maleate cis-trans isomerase [Actinokineospora globicatena]GLW91181.1 putative decarboxylase [Actinokineospora globicatena]
MTTQISPSPGRWVDDGWNTTVRMGVVVPHADVGPENELRAMAPDHLSVHAGRLHFSAMRAGGEMDPTIPHDPVRAFTEPPHLDNCVEQLAQAPLDVIGCAFTSSAYKHGPRGEHALAARLAEHARGMPVTTTCLAAEQAIRALGVDRLALVNPPWFDEELSAAGAAYFTALGVDVVHHGACGLRSGQPHITPPALYDWIRSIAGGASAVFVAGNGMRAVGIISALEDRLGIPVLTANQVLLWHVMELTGTTVSRPGYGKLMNMYPST